MIKIGSKTETSFKIFRRTKDYFLTDDQIKKGIYINASGGSGKNELMNTILFNGQAAGYKFVVIDSYHISYLSSYLSIKDLNINEKISIIFDKETISNDFENLEEMKKFDCHDKKQRDVVFYFYNSTSKNVSEEKIKEKIDNIIKTYPEHIVIYHNVHPKFINTENNSNPYIIIGHINMNCKAGTNLFMRCEISEFLEKEQKFSKQDIENIMFLNEGMFLDANDPKNIYTAIFMEKNYSKNSNEDITKNIEKFEI